MGKNIGRLGVERPPLDLEFSYFGDTVIRVHPYATDQVEIEFLEAADSIDVSRLEGLDLTKLGAMDQSEQADLMRTMNDAQRAAFRAMMKSLRQLIHPDDFATYWRLGTENGQQIRDRMRDIRSITDAVLAAETDFPTGQPGDSQRGQMPTPDSSAAGSPSAAEASDMVTALALERGRPDIQEFFVMEQEAKEQREREARESAERDHQRLQDAGLA
jgi:hypothetical protein